VRARLAHVVYGPPDWLVDKFSSRDRRAFGFWTLVFSVVGAVFFGREVLYVTVLSIVALVPNFSSETPVETEDEQGKQPPA
jgi:hypothetical protein